MVLKTDALRQKIKVTGLECVKHDNVFLSGVIAKFDNWHEDFQTAQATKKRKLVDDEGSSSLRRKRRKRHRNISDADVENESEKEKEEWDEAKEEEEEKESLTYTHRGTRSRPIVMH